MPGLTMLGGPEVAPRRFCMLRRFLRGSNPVLGAAAGQGRKAVALTCGFVGKLLWCLAEFVDQIQRLIMAATRLRGL